MQLRSVPADASDPGRADGRESRTSIDLMIYLSFAQTKSADERIAVAIDPDVRRPARGRTS
jgi:hypothetical protein